MMVAADALKISNDLGDAKLIVGKVKRNLMADEQRWRKMILQVQKDYKQVWAKTQTKAGAAMTWVEKYVLGTPPVPVSKRGSRPDPYTPPSQADMALAASFVEGTQTSADTAAELTAEPPSQSPGGSADTSAPGQPGSPAPSPAGSPGSAGNTYPQGSTAASTVTGSTEPSPASYPGYAPPAIPPESQPGV
jgi:hypothetical protein